MINLITHGVVDIIIIKGTFGLSSYASQAFSRAKNIALKLPFLLLSYRNNYLMETLDDFHGSRAQPLLN